jgi:hypothetical protein
MEVFNDEIANMTTSFATPSLPYHPTSEVVASAGAARRSNHHGWPACASGKIRAEGATEPALLEIVNLFREDGLQFAPLLQNAGINIGVKFECESTTHYIVEANPQPLISAWCIQATIRAPYPGSPGVEAILSCTTEPEASLCQMLTSLVELLARSTAERIWLPRLRMRQARRA